MADGKGRWPDIFHGLFSCSRLSRSLSSMSLSLPPEAVPGAALLNAPSMRGSLMIACVSGSTKIIDSPLPAEVGATGCDGAEAATDRRGGALRSGLAEGDS